jgi:hypothetical protein
VSTQTTLSAESHVAERQFLLEEQTWNRKFSNVPSKTSSFQKRRADFGIEVNFNENYCIKMIRNRLRWCGHNLRMNIERFSEKVLNMKLKGKHP